MNLRYKSVIVSALCAILGSLAARAGDQTPPRPAKAAPTKTPVAVSIVTPGATTHVVPKKPPTYTAVNPHPTGQSQLNPQPIPPGKPVTVDPNR